MAPNGEAPAMAAAVAPLLATIMGSFGSGEHRRQRTPSSHELRICVADHDSMEMEDGGHDGGGGGGDPQDAARPADVEDAQCECCGMSEECTPAYIGAVRRRFSGRWVCGHPALFQADAVIDIVRRLSGPRSQNFNAGPRAIGDGAKNALAGSSGCMALVAGVGNDQVVTN